MKKIISPTLFALLFSLSLVAQKKSDEKEFIKKMCGCYEVNFEYSETFSPSKDYEFHDRYSASGLEWIFVDEEDKDKIVIQHLLIISDSMIIKHWREDWLYENKELLVYQKNLEWKKETVPSHYLDKSWTQKVYQVDDSPRYNGFAHWVHLDGKTYWESQVSAPLPRREYTKRSDYNVMLRTNKHKITEYGHLHELDNAKVLRTEGGDSIIVLEKGHNNYKKVEDGRCNPALKWWNSNRPYWVDVRAVWGEKISDAEFINIKEKVKNKKLWQELFALGDKYENATSYDSEEVRLEIEKIIESFLSKEPSTWESVSTKY